ncbi:MAG TPA: RluA family pseudouridine synthase [Polyangiaceae bacterium]
MSIRDFLLAPDEKPERLDKLLCARLPELGRKRAGELCDQGRVRVDGRRAKKGSVVQPGSRVELEWSEPAGLEPEPEHELSVLLEQPQYVVVDKPAGTPTAPLSLAERGSLCGALLARYPEMAEVGHRRREPGIVHRLDTQTSGLVLAARTPRAFSRLSQALDSGALKKQYLAVVSGETIAESGEIARALQPDTTEHGRVRVLDDDEIEVGYARLKVTRYRRLRVGAGRALLELRLESAFRHQIRAHLAAIGHPIVGDRLYGGEREPRLGERHALHASQLAWSGDADLRGFSVSAPLPETLARLLDEA